MAVKELIFPVAQLVAKEGNIDTVWDFLAVLYAAQEKIGTDELWNRELVDGLKAISKNFAVQGVIAQKIHAFPKSDVAKIWAEFQVMMNDVHGVLDSAQYSLLGYDYRVAQAGLVHPVDPTEIVASDSTVISSGILTPLDYANDWNSLLVPYEATLGNTVDYLTPLLGTQSLNWFRKTKMVNNYFSGFYY